jgi:hypothetical protein
MNFILDGNSRLRQLLNNKITVKKSSDYFGVEKGLGKLLAAYTDGSNEFIFNIDVIAGPVRVSELYFEYPKNKDDLRPKADQILKECGVKVDNTNYSFDVHTLVLPNQEMYQFILPSVDMLKKE